MPIEVITDNNNNNPIQVNTSSTDANVELEPQQQSSNSIGATTLYGPKGEDGRGIVSIEKTSTSGLVDTYTITFTDNTTTTFTVTNGEKGDTGDTGDTGNGIASVEKTSTSGLVDTYTITFTDDTTVTFDVTNGEKGDTGNTGATGNGIASISKTATSGLTDTYTITFTNGTTTTFDVVNGQDGVDGTDGIDGTDGQDGYSPTATVTQSGSVTTISITDVNGTTTESIDLTDYANLIPVTYSELVTLKSGGNLVEGAFYRITDYVTTSNGITFDGAEQNRSAGHAFDIIIQAVGNSNLAEIGTAALHAGDTYFANCNLGAWQIWYDINNNTSKYVWADTTNGKGVIYRMIDEHGNDLAYDFKNIQFYRDNTASKYSDIASSLTASDGYYYTFSYYANGAVKDLSIYDNSICTYNTVSGGRGLSRGAIGVNNIIFINPDISSYYFTGNKIGEESYSNTIIGWSYGNNFGMFFRDNIIKTQLYENEFSHSFKNNIVLGASFHHNHFLGVAYNNKFIQSNGAIYNTFGINFHDNTFNGTWVQGNQFGTYFYSNTFSGTVQVNQFCNYINGNTVTANFNYNTINDYFVSNTVNGQFDYNITGSYVYRNTFNVVQTCNFGNAIIDNTFAGAIKTSTLNNWIRNISFPADVNNVFIDNKIVGSSTSNRLNLTGIPTNISYDIHILLDVNGAVIAKWNDGANETGLIKSSVTASTWSDLLPTYTYGGS